jgi:hypothetical protein
MSNNRFSNLRKAKLTGEKQSSVIESLEDSNLNPDLSLPPPKVISQRGRPRAKRSSQDFAQATAYIRKETYTAVKHLLLDQKKEYSVLVQELLDEWLKKQN